MPRLPIDPPGLPRVLVKVCGLTDVGEALSCARLGVDWVGLNFYPGSPRCVDLCTASEIARELPDGCRPVGLFVNESPARVAETAARVGLKVIQLHGDEPPEDLAALRDFQVVRAFRLADDRSVDRLCKFLGRADELGFPPHAVLVDAYVPGQAGGTGKVLAADLLQKLPPLPRLILAGGLTPENVGGLVETVRPWMVDVASGVEASPGRKSPDRVAAFMRAVGGGSI